MVVRQQLGRKVLVLRQGAGWSQERLAEEAGISVNFVGQLERGERAPSIPTLEKLAGVFKVPLKYFFDFDDPPIKGAAEMCRELEQFCDYLRIRDLEEVRMLRRIAEILFREPKKPRKAHNRMSKECSLSRRGAGGPEKGSS